VRTLRSLSALALATITASLPALAAQPDDTSPWAAPHIDRATAVFDTRTGDLITFDAMLDELATADAVFLGETHIDETTHRVELAVYEGLLARRDNKVVLAMEMFERDVQPILDQYTAGEIDEPEFLAAARPWGQYRSAYRPMIERARLDNLPVIASNFPRALTRRIAMEGLEVLDTLAPDERAHAPAEIFANTPAYWKRVDNAIRGHIGMMPAHEPGDERLTSTQTLWDNAMGESSALALDAHPGSAVLHVNGAFHSAYRGGTVRQFALRKPNAKVLTLDVTPTRNPAVGGVDADSENPVADFVVFAESRATDENEGKLTVALNRTLDYRLHLPDTATHAPVPLLIWLSDDGLTSQDGMDLWKDRLGGEAAIAVLEPTYRAQMPDLSEGGRWFWPDSFAQDIFSVVSATDRVWAYLLRYHNIDPARVVIAGEGTGATLAAVIALQGDRMNHTALAFGPKQYAKLKDFPLPLPEYNDRSDLEVSLTVFGSEQDRSWWTGELSEYREVGSDGSFAVPESNAASRDQRAQATIRDAMGLPAADQKESIAPAHLVVAADTPRAWHWSRLFALKHTAQTGQPVALMNADLSTETTDAAPEITPEISPDTIADHLPKCPGPFGGTTILVLPENTPAADIEAWLEIETNDPLNAKSRFHRLRIARTGPDAGDRSLTAMLTQLEAKNRKNVLIVPAVFCADAITMQDLERQTRDAADRMTIQWLPGLGQNAPVSE
jgi:uncharacterized iron-regulated protein